MAQVPAVDVLCVYVLCSECSMVVVHCIVYVVRVYVLCAVNAVWY